MTLKDQAVLLLGVGADSREEGLVHYKAPEEEVVMNEGEEAFKEGEVALVEIWEVQKRNGMGRMRIKDLIPPLTTKKTFPLEKGVDIMVREDEDRLLTKILDTQTSGKEVTIRDLD